MADEKNKPDFFIVGQKHGPPTLEDLLALTKALSGRDPTPADVKKARETYESRLQKARGHLHVRELPPDEDATFRKIHYAAVHGLAAGHYPQEILDKWSAPIREGERVQPRRQGRFASSRNWMGRRGRADVDEDRAPLTIARRDRG